MDPPHGRTDVGIGTDDGLMEFLVSVGTSTDDLAAALLVCDELDAAATGRSVAAAAPDVAASEDGRGVSVGVGTEWLPRPSFASVGVGVDSAVAVSVGVGPDALTPPPALPSPAARPPTLPTTAGGAGVGTSIAPHARTLRAGVGLPLDMEEAGVGDLHALQPSAEGRGVAGAGAGGAVVQAGGGQRGAAPPPDDPVLRTVHSVLDDRIAPSLRTLLLDSCTAARAAAVRAGRRKPDPAAACATAAHVPAMEAELYQPQEAKLLSAVADARHGGKRCMQTALKALAADLTAAEGQLLVDLLCAHGWTPSPAKRPP